ncbi:hypothetical protein [Marinococcus luteus]|uniref:hypothetical protein n=1 Tax=Marinococcus luteus TaxID=1122204 RepID=UPI002ACC9B6C|nr:hypothetical protein [Marinococcus luteus]MDZ5782076.1 hypothetical protein [Marinococcus luteus]
MSNDIELGALESQYGQSMNDGYKSKNISITLTTDTREQHCDNCECFLLPDEHLLCVDCEEEK